MIFKPSVRALLFIALVIFGARIANAQEPLSKDFDEYVAKALKDWQVPGVAIAVVKNDAVVFAKGYGVRKLGDTAPVNEKTLFAIGSASKAFTAASIAMLVDEGKLKWDDPAAKYLSGFELYDPYATRELTVRDLLCHRSGLERGDLLWYGSALNRDEILRRVRYLKPSWSFRSLFGYQNIMFLAAGQILPSVSGKDWDTFVKARIFKPLGMTSTNTSIKDLAGLDNVATPHAKIDEKVEIIPWRNIDNIAPAGAINSNAVDMAQWVRLQLGEGKYKDDRLISSGSVKEMHTPQTIIRAEGIWEKLFPESHFLTYGMGWFLTDYRGRKIVQHGGNIDGMSALVGMAPEEKLGLVILTNMNGTSLPTALMNKIIDLYMHAPEKDWSAEMLKSIRALEAQGEAAEKKIEQARIKGTHPSLSLDKYSGSYKDEMYGEARIASENGKLVLHFGPAFIGDLEHWHYDTFRATWRDRSLGKGLVTFTLNAEGKIEGMKVQNLADFKRGPDPADTAAGIKLSEPELRVYAGKYEAKGAPIEISIEMMGGQLKAIVPGQPVYTLTPLSRTRFRIEGAPAGFFANFELDGKSVKAMIIEQGQGITFRLEPKQ